MGGEEWHVFYKPFKRTEVPGRAMEPLAWSVGVVYPVDDIYGNYNRLFNYLMAGGTLALTVLFLLLWAVIKRQLKPLETLTTSAREIAAYRTIRTGRLTRHFSVHSAVSEPSV